MASVSRRDGLLRNWMCRHWHHSFMILLQTSCIRFQQCVPTISWNYIGPVTWFRVRNWFHTSESLVQYLATSCEIHGGRSDSPEGVSPSYFGFILCNLNLHSTTVPYSSTTAPPELRDSSDHGAQYHIHGDYNSGPWLQSGGIGTV
jgi:hypothetical protein